MSKTYATSKTLATLANGVRIVRSIGGSGFAVLNKDGMNLGIITKDKARNAQQAAEYAQWSFNGALEREKPAFLKNGK